MWNLSSAKVQLAAKEQRVNEKIYAIHTVDVDSEENWFYGWDIVFTTRNAHVNAQAEEPEVSCWELTGQIYERRQIALSSRLL